MAKTQVAYTKIIAPFDGVVGLRKISPGDYVNVGQELANFVSYDPMKVDFSIPETQANVLGVGQPIEIVVEAMPGKTFLGEVYALDPQLDVSGRAVSLRARIPNPDYQLKPGYFARVMLTVERRENAMVIPESAVVPQGDAKFAFKVGDDDAVALVPLTLGKRLSGEVEVLEGLQVGDRVVTCGQIKLQHGAKVMDKQLMMQKMQQQQGGAAPESAAEVAPEAAPAEMAPPVESPDKDGANLPSAMGAMPEPAMEVPAAEAGAVQTMEPPAQPYEAAPLSADEGDGVNPAEEMAE